MSNVINIWKELNWFSQKENWGDPDKMDINFLLLLDMMRDYTVSLYPPDGLPFIVHRAYDPFPELKRHLDGSRHYVFPCSVVDGHFKGISLLDQLLIAERFNFDGIGVYGRGVWNSPGMHLEKGGESYRRWACEPLKDIGNKKYERKYVRLDGKYIRKYGWDLEERYESNC